MPSFGRAQDAKKLLLMHLGERQLAVQAASTLECSSGTGDTTASGMIPL
jgi:hypothetical protein